MKRTGKDMSLIRRIAALTLVVLFFISAMPVFPGSLVVHAADNFVSVSLNGAEAVNRSGSISNLNSYLTSNKNKAIVLDMLNDWDAAKKSEFDCALVIPSGANVTLNMHGYAFNRNNAASDDYSSDGEVIRVESGASLTINGSSNDAEKARKHESVPVYTGYSEGIKANGRTDIKGGTIMGGVSSYTAGGIYVKDRCTVVLNDVTIAGCCSRDTWYSINGYGGGIWLYEDDCRLTLNNSRITGCMSDDLGGGICVNNDDTMYIELKNSTIDKNYATKKGGGIYLGGEGVYVNGSGDAIISGNQSGEAGGGVYLQDQNESMSGLTISGNKSVNGAGIYMEGGVGTVLNSAQVLTDLKIKDNAASGRGGGIYIKKEMVTISSCKITGNKAGTSGSGVYVYDDVNEGFNVKGATIIKDNTVGSGKSNLYIADDKPENSRVMFDLTKGAEVHMSYYGIGTTTAVMVTEGGQKKSPNCIQYLHADNAGYHFTFNSAANSRKIYYVKDGSDNDNTGKPVAVPDPPTKISPGDAINNGVRVTDHGTGAGIVGKVGSGGVQGTEYDLIRGFTRHQETDSDTNDTAVAFYYSDAFFDAEPTAYNEHLATASLNMAYAGMYLRANEAKDGNDNTYYNKHAAARQFMADIGCPDQNIYVNDSNEKKPGTDTIGVTIASKKLKKADGNPTGKILIPIVTRGGGYELEWSSNGTLNKASQMNEDGKKYEAAGFSYAADQVMEEVHKYIKKYDLQAEINAGNVKFWIAGYSRGGATANITAKRLIEEYADGSEAARKNNQVFAYTCEAPMGGSDAAETLNDKTQYYSIHNMINAVDVVPLVAPELMGFKRYGVDHYIPGKNRSGNPGAVVGTEPESVNRGGEGTAELTRTTYSDNVQILIKQLESGDPGRKAKMLLQLKAVDSGLIYDDYFHPMAMDVVPPSTYENGNYDNNHIEKMVEDFIRFAQEGKVPAQVGGEWSQAIPSRDYYAQTLQPAIRDMLALVFGMDSEKSAGFMGRAGTIVDRIPMISVGSGFDLAGFYTSVFRLGWHTLDFSKKQFYKTALWDKLKETGALEKLSPEDAGKLERHWPVLIDFVLTLAEADYNYKPIDKGYGQGWAGGSDKTMMLLGSFTTYSNFILQNHYPEVNLAWARAYDSYYDNETTEYEVACGVQATGYAVAAPTATAKGDGDPVEVLTEGTENSKELTGSQKIILENQGIVGEAIYYDLVEKDNDGNVIKTIESNRLYRGGIDLNNPGDDITKNYTIETYDISYGVRNTTKAVYNISLTGNSNNKVFSSIEQPADISGVPYGETNEEIKSRMPRTATIITEDGSRIPVELIGTWTITDINPTADEDRDARELTVSQTIEMPAGVDNSNNKSRDVVVKVYVNEAPTAGPAKADLNSGVFLYDQKTTLSTEEADGAVWYAFGNSNDSNAYTQYSGGDILIKRDNEKAVDEKDINEQGEEISTGRKILYLNVKTVKDGMWDSPVVTYEYIFETGIAVPESQELIYNAKEQTGVKSSSFYTISASGGAKINDTGEAVAENAGEYTATLSLKADSGTKWKLSDNEVTDADQTVTFTIAPRDISETVTLSAAGTFNTLDELKSAIRVSPKGELNPVSGTDYTLSYSTISDSRVTATLTGKGNYTGTVSASFTMGDQGGGSSGGGSSGGGTGGGSSGGGSSGGGNDQDDGDGNDDGNNEGENEGGNGTQYDSSIFAGGASIKEAEEVLLSLTSDKDPGGTSFTPIRVLSTKQTKTAVKLGWTKTKGAVRYNIYAAKSDKKDKFTKVASVTGTSKTIKKIGGKTLEKGAYYSFMVIAVDKNDKVVSSSVIIYVATEGGKVSNYSAVKTGVKGNKVSLKKGAKFKLKATAVIKNKKLKVKKHSALRYVSANKKIATVSKKGVIKAKKKGKCYIYVYAQNGIYKRVKLTVK